MTATNMGSPFAANNPNKPAGTSTLAANPNTGVAVLLNAFDGPTGSPFTTYDTSNSAPSTGALVTGIGFGAGMGQFFTTVGAQATPGTNINGAPVMAAGYRPGVTRPWVSGAVNTAMGDSTLVAIGGGKSTYTAAPSDGVSFYSVVPYTAGFGLCAMGGGDGTTDATAGGSLRDVAATPGSGLPVIYAGPVVTTDSTNGAVITTGITNRCNATVVIGQYQIGVSTTANGVPA